MNTSLKRDRPISVIVCDTAITAITLSRNSLLLFLLLFFFAKLKFYRKDKDPVASIKQFINKIDTAIYKFRI